METFSVDRRVSTSGVSSVMKNDKPTYIFQAWDLGYGFTMPELYKTGYTVLGLSTILALAIACLQMNDFLKILLYYIIN